MNQLFLANSTTVLAFSLIYCNTTAASSALNTEQLLTVDTPTLCKLLCCGRYTAIQIGDLAHARIVTNSRVLWSVQRIKEYVYKIAC